MKNKTFKKFGFILLSLIIIALIFIISFFTTSYGPSTQAMANLEDSTLVDVTEDNFIASLGNFIGKWGICLRFYFSSRIYY